MSKVQQTPNAKRALHEHTIRDFGIEVLQIMQDNEEWSADTMDEINAAAAQLKLTDEKADVFTIDPQVMLTIKQIVN